MIRSLFSSLLVTIPIQKTGGNSTYQTLPAPLTAAATQGRLTFLFKSPAKGQLMSLDWIEFTR